MYPTSEMIRLYEAGYSTPQIAEIAGINASSAWRRLSKQIKMRNHSSSVSLANTHGRGGCKTKGIPRPMSEEWKKKLLEAANSAKRDKAKGYRITKKGYMEYTYGENEGRSFHTVAMEEKIGRRINKNEVVHHIDGDKLNNKIENLALMTNEEHSRLHREIEKNSGMIRHRNKIGRFERISE